MLFIKGLSGSGSRSFDESSEGLLSNEKLVD
jgi:hypothetical protein